MDRVYTCGQRIVQPAAGRRAEVARRSRRDAFTLVELLCITAC